MFPSLPALIFCLKQKHSISISETTKSTEKPTPRKFKKKKINKQKTSFTSGAFFAPPNSISLTQQINKINKIKKLL